MADGHLRITAPKGAVSPDLLKTLRERKVELIALHNTQARTELDRFFTEVVLPRLTDLHKAGKLPDLTHDPRWAKVEATWDMASINSTEPCDIEGTKRAMLQAVDAYDPGSHSQQDEKDP